MAYNWKITARKFGISLLIIFITGLIIYWQKDVRYITLIPFAEALLNFLKHRKSEIV